MADFKTHLGWSIGGGIILAAAGLHARHLMPIEGLAVTALAGIGGGIPDIDQEKSIPYRFFNHFLSLVAPIVILLHLKPKIGSELWINILFYIFFSAIIYQIIGPIIKKMTKHRGVMHSIPFAILGGELTYLFFASDYELFKLSSKKMPVYFGVAVFWGHIIHLVVDEFYSMWDKKKKKIKIKKSLGTALTMYSKDATPLANLMLYMLVILAAFAINSQDITFRKVLGVFIGTHKIQSIKMH
jgi:hypothetical protein